MKTDYIYLIHKYAYNNLEEGASYQATIKYLEENAVKTDNVHVMDSIKRTFSQVFIDSNRASIGFDPNYTGKYYMLTDAYYRYLEYMELAESRKNAEEAKRHATTAIILTLVALAASILIGLVQIYFAAGV